jgi:LysM repeat protein
MNNPNNPFVPKGSLLDLQGRRRSQLKIAVFCVVAVGAVSLSAMLIQGCERKKPDDTLGQETLGAMTNVAMAYETTSNLPPVSAVSNAVTQMAQVVESNTGSILPPSGNELTQPGVSGGDYKIVKGDTLDKIAKHYGVSVKAIEAVNPKLDPKRLKIGDKVVIPAAMPKTPSASGASPVGANVYVVKPGDSLGKIAKSHGTTVTALKAVNSLATDRINVGQHLTIPDKSVAAPVTAPVMTLPEPTLTPPPAPGATPVK